MIGKRMLYSLFILEQSNHEHDWMFFSSLFKRVKYLNLFFLTLLPGYKGKAIFCMSKSKHTSHKKNFKFKINFKDIIDYI